MPLAAFFAVVYLDGACMRLSFNFIFQFLSIRQKVIAAVVGERL